MQHVATMFYKGLSLPNQDGVSHNMRRDSSGQPWFLIIFVSPLSGCSSRKQSAIRLSSGQQRSSGSKTKQKPPRARVSSRVRVKSPPEPNNEGVASYHPEKTCPTHLCGCMTGAPEASAGGRTSILSVASSQTASTLRVSLPYPDNHAYARYRLAATNPAFPTHYPLTPPCPGRQGSSRLVFHAATVLLAKFWQRPA